MRSFPLYTLRLYFYYFLMLLYTIMLFAIGEYIEGGLAYIYGNDRRPWAAFPAPREHGRPQTGPLSLNWGALPLTEVSVRLPDLTLVPHSAR